MRGIEKRAGLMALVGVAGCGKTTLLRTIEDAIARNRGLALYRPLPEEGFEGLLGSLLDELRLVPASPGREDGLDTLGEFLGGRNTPSVLLVDEAHRVPNRTLVGLAGLAMFQHGETESLQVILAGQSQLEERLQRPELAWIADHVAVTVHLDPLLADELADYVVHRLALARSSLSLRRTRNPFVPEALNRLLHYSNGVPGTLNRLCRSALSGRPKRVDVARVDQAAFECGLMPPPGSVPAAAIRPPPVAPALQERDMAPQTIARRRVEPQSTVPGRATRSASAKPGSSDFIARLAERIARGQRPS
jgi:type II secretory pathway predicted ATPase ExeA